MLDRVLAVHGPHLSHAIVDVDSGGWLAAESAATEFAAASPRSSLSFECSVLLAPKTRTGTPASFSTAPRRNACAA